MSWRARLLALVLRGFARPRLARCQDPDEIAAEFERAARLVFRPPPHFCDRIRPAGPVTLHWISTALLRPGRVVLYLHGGAYFAGSGATHGPMLGRLSRLAGVEICAPDYRLLQQAPFPAALEDAEAAWAHLAGLGYAPSDIVLGGDSAGGGLALALLARLLARGERPAGLFAFSPWTDLTLSGETIRSNARAELILPAERMHEVVERYLAGADPADPRASPLFAAFRDPPPVLLQVGGEEVLLDDTRRMAGVLRAAGASVTEEVWPGLPHVWQLADGWIPEARAALRSAARFVQTSLDRASR